jgi:hypothetical protein
MLTNLFESRNKTFLNLVKLGDYLARSLRENVELFNVEDNTVTYLSESGQAIRGEFDGKALKLNNITVEDARLFEDKEVYSKLVDKKVNGFLADILENDLDKVQESFDSILGLWETRLHFDRVKERLVAKIERFDERTKIVSTEEFARVVEMKNDLVKLLKESSGFINIPEIRNTIKLSSVISKSFNTPKITYDSLAEAKNYEIPATVNHTLYDHLCKHELITKELVEAKSKLDTVWLTNDKVQKLPTFIYESDENVMKLLSEIIVDVPYFAMATKKQISNLVENNLDLLVDTKAVPAKDVKEFAAKIFEFKKPVKEYVTNLLNEKYGVNVQNLTDVPTFDALVKTHIVIFESLGKLSPKNSVLKKTLYEFAESLKNKNGVEAIDVSDFLDSVFKECEYDTILHETSLMNYLNFDKVADDLGKIGQVLKMIQAGMGGGAGPAAGGGMPPAAAGMAAEMPEGEGQYETDGGEDAGMDMLPAEDGEAADEMPAMDAEDAAAEVQGEEAAEEMGEEEGEEGGNLDGYEDEAEFVEKDELIDNMRELEELIAMLKSDMGADEGEGEEVEMEGEEEGEESPLGDGDGDEMPPIDTGEGEDEVHIDVGSHNDGEEDEEEEDAEEEPPAKPKKKKGKSED